LKRFEEEEVQTGRHLLDQYRWKQGISVETETDLNFLNQPKPKQSKHEPFTNMDWADSEIFKNVNNQYQ